jgi:hypothetical protein
MSAEELERLTPASRDRYVDFLRAFSIVVVVIGHWTIALIFREDQRRHPTMSKPRNGR